MATMATAGPGGSQELHPGLPHGSKGPSTWSIFCCFSQAHQQGAGLEVEQLGLKLVPMWDTGAAGSSLTLCATVPAPFSFHFITGI